MLNPLLKEAGASLVRSILKLGAGYLVARGIWTQDEASHYVAGLALALVGLAWSYWTTYASRQKLVTAMAMPSGVSENQVQAAITDPAVVTPPVTLSKDAVSRPMAHPPDPPKAA